MILFVYWNIFYGHVCHDVPVTCIAWQTEKISKKQPVFKDKSDDSKKVAIVRKTLGNTLWGQQFSTNFGLYFVIVDLTVRSTKKL